MNSNKLASFLPPILTSIVNCVQVTEINEEIESAMDVKTAGEGLWLKFCYIFAALFGKYNKRHVVNGKPTLLVHCLLSPRNHKRTTSSLALPIFYVAKIRNKKIEGTPLKVCKNNDDSRHTCYSFRSSLLCSYIEK